MVRFPGYGPVREKPDPVPSLLSDSSLYAAAYGRGESGAPTRVTLVCSIGRTILSKFMRHWDEQGTSMCLCRRLKVERAKCVTCNVSLIPEDEQQKQSEQALLGEASDTATTFWLLSNDNR